MAKTRFRRKSHGKKNKTARRQKRQSRRMRGGSFAIDPSKLIGWSKQNPNCDITVSSGTYGFPPKTINARNIKGQNFEALKKYVKLNDRAPPHEVNLESGCDYVLTNNF